MGPINQNRIVKATVGISLQGQMSTINMHYFQSGVVDHTNVEDFVATWEAGVLPQLCAAIGIEAKPSFIKVQGVGAGNVLPSTDYFSNQVGSINDESLPSNVAAILQLRQTEVSGKHNGRVFIPGVPEGKCVDNLLTTGYVGTELAALATAMQGPLVGSITSWSPCVVHVSDPGPPIVYEGYEVTLIRPIRNMGTQRRRTTSFREFHP